MIEKVEMFGLHVVPHVTFHPRTVLAVCAVVTKAGTQIEHLRHYQLLVVAGWNGKQNKYTNYKKSFIYLEYFSFVCPHVHKPGLMEGFI